LEQENKHQRITQLYLVQPSKKAIQDYFILIFPDSHRYFSSALYHQSSGFTRQLAPERANNTSPSHPSITDETLKIQLLLL
jgi:hypothetical protein